MHKYQFLLFDLDGTVTDSGPGIMNAAHRALLAYNIEEADRERLRLFVGPPLDKSFMERYGFSEEDAWKAVAVFREYYNVTGIFENSVYPGIEEMLKSLKERGYILAIASSKPQIMIHRVLKHFDIEKYFDVIVGCELDGTRSSKSEVVTEVLSQLSNLAKERNLVNPHEMGDTDIISQIRMNAVMIGDRFYDVEGAHALELPCIGILYGYGSRQEMEDAKADFIFETVKDLENFFEADES
jgi:phosphoglycolate phosphatase